MKTDQVGAIQANSGGKTVPVSTIPVTFSGNWGDTSRHIMAIFQAGFDVRLEHCSVGRLTDVRPIIVGTTLDEHTSLPVLQRLSHHGSLAWFAWNRDDSPRLALEAYQAGAQSVLPSSFTTEVLLSTINRLHAALERDNGIGSGPSHATRQQRYERGQVIIPEQYAVMEVIEGVIAVTVIHEDGAEVLLGLCGPGQTLVGHPEDSCSIRLRSHTATAVRVRSWDEAMQDIELPQQMRVRLQQMEAWAAMQARPHLDQRIMGLLSLLAEQFGRQQNKGMVIDVRITHQQLASAIGATRTTITRLLRDMKRAGQLTTIGSGNSERFCLLDWEQHRH
jgi:CRP-like cAMP-binding protein